ncbi:MULTISPECIES: DUF1003 domain-containing protein [Sinorhizobium/Ensifer group]|jgi:uncharacterized membrane protein|uniref:DUF1003 domain-containing protein n=1 Tax=Sinorhizobium/Ensifer group TaxID=227292 RepID=UPI00070CAC54|nr:MULTISPECIES: DUF1003 domain-containing protein [Sinorhizobium/Ensifer group]KRD71729.1 hypothetical protein ASE60_24325 [Ensifer sp. Root278]KSV70097.1 hypothetical protein N183_05600 [Sinorhizobium sp. Sb3]KSV87876.1 hypothetical protein N184_09445 [Sinorhizobium sp. GL28]MBD9506709.1 DUF1003 domain-containing protein [Ensifer sp. ENS10]MBV7521865.1 DUF1003 domain-containing protein [Ensifer sp. ENS12]
MPHFNNISHQFFGKPLSELGEIERRILAYARERRTLTTDTNAAFAAEQTLGDRLADNIARVGGSWSFIVTFCSFLVCWVIVNSVLLVTGAFDPYPYIFLNLVLSMLAALQAPIIMMSQNRQAERDRFAASKDYEVNLKSEVELIALHHKVDDVLLREISELRADLATLNRQLEHYRPAPGQD